MEENKKAIENEENDLSEEELEAVAGGMKLSNIACWFRPTGKTKIDSDGKTCLECDHACWTLLGAFCACHDSDNCTNKWHRIDEERKLAPNIYRNHKDKSPDNNYKDQS